MQNPSSHFHKGRLSTIPSFHTWMVVVRVLVDLVASSIGQAIGILLWMVSRDELSFDVPLRALEIYLAGETICLLSMSMFDLYTPHRSLLDLKENRQLLRAWLTALAGTRLFLFFLQIQIDASVLLCLWISILPSLYFGRQFFHWVGEQLRRAGIGETAALVYGAGETGIRLVRELRRTPELGIQVVGFLDDRIGATKREVDGVPLLGDYSALEPILAEGRVRRLYIALPQVPRRTILDILAVCRRHDIVFQIVPSLTDQLLSLIEFQDMDGVPLLGPTPLGMSFGPRVRKRILDLVLAIPLLCLVAPCFLVLVPLVRRSTGGTALVGLPVVGVGGRPFRLLRFRTMSAKIRPELHRIPGDSRLRPIGRFLRASLLEIAPELWNVVRGDVSMVGPRPLGLREAASLDPRHRFRLELPPGLTGLWKVDPRPRLDPADELELDLQYLRLRSFLLDITVLLRSLDEFLRKQGLR